MSKSAQSIRILIKGDGKMARSRHVNATKLDIVKVVSKIFLEKGYTNTTSRMICEELDISTGNLTYHFPTKEHILAVLVELLCDFQDEMMEQTVEEGKTTLMALCMELTAMAAICEENEIMKDFYLSAYTHPASLEIIRRNDKERAKDIFGEYCYNWQERNYQEAETLVSGIEFATLMTTESSAPLNVRIAGALGGIMMIYNVPEEIKRRKIEKVLSMDYRAVGRRIFHEFTEYIENVEEDTLERILKRKTDT